MKRVVMLACLIFVLSSVHGQKVIKTSGSLDALKGEKSFNLIFSYDNLMVGKKSESEYINEKVANYNSKEQGRGDKWKDSWFNDRPSRYEPKFEELFNKSIRDIDRNASKNNGEARYTIQIKSTMIEPGWHVGVMRSPAYLNVDIEIYPTKNPESIVASYKIDKIMGRDVAGYDFDAGLRVSESYAKLGKVFGKFMVKNLK